MAIETRTEHPHIVRAEGVAGGQPVIVGTRISVAFIARLLQVGETAEDIIASYPHLAPAAVYDALSYYLDHKDEVDRHIADHSPEKLARSLGFTIGDKGQVIFGARHPANARHVVTATLATPRPSAHQARKEALP